MGGKRGLVATLARFMPSPDEVQGVGYREVCVGGGALFFERYRDVRPVTLSDSNPRLINAYVAVRDHLPSLLATLSSYQARFDACPDADAFWNLFMEVRGAEPTSDVARAAWLITLNRTCMNGLYRENRSGGFNVGPGKWWKEGEPFRMPALFDRHRLEACSRALQGVRLVVSDFEVMFQAAKPGELVFADPPYLPVSETANFTSYTAGGFDLATHRRFAEAVSEAAKRGVRVVVCNSDTPMSRTLYSRFTIHTVEARRSVNSDGSGRGPVNEIVVVTF